MRTKVKIALRRFLNDKLFSTINILGLALGLAVCLLITVYVLDELNYDDYNYNRDRIFRVVCDIRMNGNGINGNFAPSPMGPVMKKDFPKIENFVRIRKIDEMLVRKSSENIIEKNAVYADSTFFDVFTIPMVVGNPKLALVDPHSIVIAESVARKYFGNVNIVGNTLLIDNETTYKITGVIKDMPRQSHFHFDFIKALSERQNINGPGHWINPFAATYLLVKPGVSQLEIDQMLSTGVSRYVASELQHDMNTSLSEFERRGDHIRYSSIPVSKIHLYSNVLNEFEPNSNIQAVYILGAIVFLILLIACMNFMNLSTARSAKRAKEVGVKKALGSSRFQLVVQFLNESLLTTFVSTLLSFGIALLLLRYFNDISGKNIPISAFFERRIIGVCLLTAFLVGTVAGSYPAFYLSSFNLRHVLTGSISNSFKSGWLRNSLVITQFSIALFLVTGTLIISSQLSFIKNKDIGYDRSQILIIHKTNNLDESAKDFESEVNKLPGVTGSTMTRFLPNLVSDGGGRGYFKDATAKASETFLLSKWIVDANYIPLLNIKMAEGRNFSSNLPTDSSCLIINETAAALLGFGKNTIGKSLYLNNNDPIGGYRIIGVVKDFNEGDFHTKTQPIAFHLGLEESTMALKIHSANISDLLGLVKQKYQSFNKTANQTFVYSFLDDDFNKLFEKERRTNNIYSSLTVFAIFIACLGLFGLVSYATEKRTKEIAIRKILGSSESSIVILLSKEFLKLVALSIVIAFPITWVVMTMWLQDFAYRTDIHWWLFVISAVVVLTITMFTVVCQSLYAARLSPVKNLRNE